MALLLTVATGAWAQTDEPTVHTKAVEVAKLKVGDILADGFSLTSDDDVQIQIITDRWKVGEESTGNLVFSLINIANYGANGAITMDNGLFTATITPVDENGQDGNAWVVMAKSPLTIGGITYDSPIDLTPSADGTVWTLSTMPEYDVELEVAYYTDEEIAAMEKIGYYLVGNMNGWTPDSKYKLTENTANPGEYMITLLLEPTSQFKVAYSEDGTTVKYWYPSDGPNYGEGGQITEDDRYTVYFKPGTGGDDWYYRCLWVASDPLYATPTGNKNEWTLDMPDYDVELEIEYETELALSETTDNSAALTEWDGYEANVTLTRTLTGGMWNTLALPFSISSSNVTQLKTFLATQSASIDFKELKTSSYANGTLTLDFEGAAEIKAGHPYLVKTSTNVNFATLPAIIDAAIATYSLPYDNPFKNVEISSAIEPTVTSVVDFIPTLGKTTVGNTGDNPKSILFLGANNTLMNPETMPTLMKGFRGYFQLKGDAVGARSFAMNIDGETTAVSDLKINEQIINNNGYDLQGRRMEGQPTKKGVYIVNGKKVVIK